MPNHTAAARATTRASTQPGKHGRATHGQAHMQPLMHTHKTASTRHRHSSRPVVALDGLSPNSLLQADEPTWLVLNDSLARWSGLRLSASFLSESFSKLKLWGRLWFCVVQGHVWTTPGTECAHAHRGWSTGCGGCHMGGTTHKRKQSLYLGLLEYVQRYKPDFDVCAPVSCRDTPSVARTSATLQKTTPPLVLSYMTSPYSWDVPFPDYTSWNGDGWEALSKQLMQTQVPWANKTNRAVLAFGNMSLNGAQWWYNEHKEAKFARIRHALLYGHCSSPSLLVVNGDRSVRNMPRRIPKMEFCRYKIIVLTYGTSQWLDHTRDALLCGSLVVFVTDTSCGTGEHQDPSLCAPGSVIDAENAYDPLSRMFVDRVNVLIVNGNSSINDHSAEDRTRLCDQLDAAIAWALQKTRKRSK